MKKNRSVVLATSVTLASLLPLCGVVAQPAPAPSDEQLKEDEYAKDSNTEINVKNAEIASIVRIFSRKTKRNYILDEKVKGKVSIYLPGKVSAEESLRILDSVLALKGFTAVPIGENLWKIVPSKEARQTTIPTITDGRTDEEGKALKPSASVVTRLLKLKYVSADDVQQIVSQLVSSDGLVNAYTGTNSLILIDSEDNIERLVRLIDELDVPFSNREMTIIPIKYAVVDDLAQKLADILGISSSKGGGAGDSAAAARARMVEAAQGIGGGLMPPQPGGVAARQSPTGKTVTARGVEPKIIPDQRTNSLIVVADDDTTARVRALVAQLDSKLDQSGNKFYVYRCQHANAEELAQVLAGLAGGGGAGMGGRTQGGAFGAGGAGGAFGSSGTGGGAFGSSSGGGAFGSSSTSSRNGGMGSGSSFGRSSGIGGGTGAGGAFGGGGMGRGGAGGRMGPMAAQLGENISLTADPATNSLIIAASKNDYEKIRALLAQLDVKRRQVIVESTLLEVSIDNNMRMSTGFLTSTGGADGGVLARSDFAAGDKGSLTTLFNSPEKLQGFTLAAASAGSLTLPGGLKIPTQTLLVSAAQQNNNVNVLSAPTILSTDNEPAQIVVGQNVPFLASTSTNATNLNNTFNQVDRQDVGITLRITPQISSRDYVNMRIFTEVSALVLSTVNSTLGPTTTKRQSETTVVAKDGQMIVTGGLIADDVSETDEGIPFLKDIPVLGHAFKSNSQSRVQKNLLIFMTPRIVKDQFDARDITIESRDRMEDVIANYGVEPLRQNVLRDESMDAVAETNPYDGPAPGTIIPPEKPEKERSKMVDPKLGAERVARVETHSTRESEEVVVDGNTSGVVDLSASNGDTKGALDLSEMEASGAPVVVAPVPESEMRDGAHQVGKLPAPEALVAGERFIVMQIQGEVADPAHIPFLLGNKRTIVGVKVPSESAEGVKRFFQSGERYVYRWKDTQVIGKVLGVYDSIPAAISSHPNAPEAWYTLSPYEIMNLGSGPWAKERD